MAKVLILFAYLDVLAGVLAHHGSERSDLIVEDYDMETARSSAKQLETAVKELLSRDFEDGATDHLSQLRAAFAAVKSIPGQRTRMSLHLRRSGDIKDPARAMLRLFERFPTSVTLGVETEFFTNNLRGKFRNKLAHMYAPALNHATESTEVSKADFQMLCDWIQSSTHPIVTEKHVINGVALLRDCERLTTSLTGLIRSDYTESEATDALVWLGLTPDSQECEE